MKLIISVDPLTNRLTGIGRYTLELVKRLSKIEEVTIISYFNRTKLLRNIDTLINNSNNVRQKASFLLPLLRFGYRILSPLFQKLVLRKYKDHIFHSPNFYVPVFPGKVIITIHDLSGVKYPQFQPKGRVSHLKTEIKKAVKRADHILTDSEFIKQELVNFYDLAPENITAIHLGVTDEYHPRTEYELSENLEKYNLDYESYSLFVSTIEPRKNIINLVEAYALLDNETKNRFPLVIIGGKGWYSEEIFATINKYSKEGWLRYIGYVPEEELPLFYAGAGSFLFPSWYEGFGLPVLEAMASGVPCLISDRSSLPEITESNAVIVDPADTQAIKQGIQKILTDRDLRETLVKKGLEVAAKKTWDASVKQTAEVYRKISNTNDIR